MWAGVVFWLFSQSDRPRNVRSDALWNVSSVRRSRINGCEYIRLLKKKKQIVKQSEFKTVRFQSWFSCVNRGRTTRRNDIKNQLAGRTAAAQQQRNGFPTLHIIIIIIVMLFRCTNDFAGRLGLKTEIYNRCETFRSGFVVNRYQLSNRFIRRSNASAGAPGGLMESIAAQLRETLTCSIFFS